MRLIQIACEALAAVRDPTESLKPAEGARGGDSVVREGRKESSEQRGHAYTACMST